MSLVSLGLWFAIVSSTSEPESIGASQTLAPRMTSPRCELWISAPAQVSFAALARRVADKVGPRSAVAVHEWTTSNQPGRGGWWVRVAETRGQWQIAYLGADGQVELEALPVLDPSTLEADIAGEVALVALSTCSEAVELPIEGAATRPPTAASSQLDPSASSRRGDALLGATIGLSVLGLAASAVGFGLSFHHYRGFKTDVEECLVDTLSGGNANSELVLQHCRSKHERTLRMHWYMSGIGTAGVVALGSGLVLAIPTALELRRARAPRARLRLLGWAGPQGAGLGLSGRF